LFCFAIVVDVKGFRCIRLGGCGRVHLHHTKRSGLWLHAADAHSSWIQVSTHCSHMLTNSNCILLMISIC